MVWQFSTVLTIKDMIIRHEECKKKEVSFYITKEDVILPALLFLTGMIFISIAFFYMAGILPS